jgi:hypothetical protein
MCQLTKTIQKIVTKLSEILVVDPVTKIRKKLSRISDPESKKQRIPESRSATLLEFIPDIDGILRNVVRHLLVFIHVAGGNRQHRPVVREGQAKTAKLTHLAKAGGPVPAT